MNETHIMFYDSYFGNFELSLEIFENYFSGFAIVLTENISDNCIILSDEQLKSIKGTASGFKLGGGLKFTLPSIGSVFKKAAGVLLRSPHVLVFAGAVLLGLLLKPSGSGYYKGPKIPYTYSNKPSYSPKPSKLRYNPPKVPKYIRSPTSSGKIRYIPNPAYVTPAIKIALEYKKNYEKYKKLKGKELGKIAPILVITTEDYKRIVIENK